MTIEASRDTGPAACEALADWLGVLGESRGQASFPERNVVLRYRDLPELADAVAVELRARGVGPGDVVGILASASPEFLTAYFGVLAAGATATVLPVGALGAELVDGLVPLMRTARIRTVLVTELFESVIESLESGGAVDVLAVRRCRPRRARPTAGSVNPNLIAAVQFSSGSAGMPKAVALSHAAILSGIRDVLAVCRITSADVFTSWLPLSHDFGLHVLLCAMAADADIHLFDPPWFIRRPLAFLQHVAETGTTVFPIPNFAVERLISAAARLADGGLDLSALRMVWNGGEVVRPDTVARFAEVFARFGAARSVMTPAYGMAEIAAPIAGTPEPADLPILFLERDSLEDGRPVAVLESPVADARGVVSSGPAFGRTEIRIVDQSGSILEQRHFGEIEIRGPAVMSGYLHNPEATAAAMREGWLRTGDTGFIWAGELYVAGRIKDVIIVSGRNFHAEDVEAVAGRIDGVHRGHCVAVADTDSERMVLLVETTEPDPTVVTERVRSQVAQRLGLGSLDVRAVRRGWLPRTTSGKWRRNLVRARLAEGGRH
ncbi:AMP-binding protein [Nocardia goodfellowii]|uniref:Acyl-CoA synthetase (AMP-forming)/AMP-acid ligase II n=1 Tax=Nocardia goodfellowii TaxID=882446 RepID=A0ABS4QLK3_9NOCA|nr:AMP-binding protein [Nocardia goodfellowii]MBP2191561.1 acyl-CoA synthetase (AMP-forming)/AMP-acid ligase II [Nocardia goodfellowii]